MPKRPPPRKTPPPPVDKEEQLSQQLCAMALDLAAHDDAALQRELRRSVRRLLNQEQDAALYGAIELARGEDVAAYRLLREAVQEDAGTVLLHKGDGPELEINAFAIPVFVTSRGGLRAEACFQDDAAYAELLDSFVQAGLEAPQARLVLVRHAYELAELDAIRYSQLNAMVREAANALLDKKVREAPALQRSIAGWQPQVFAADDEALQLRFLLGFALKRADDPFYREPPAGPRQDAWFEARMRRYQEWTVAAAPLVQRCLANDGRVQRLDFLYQDLFHGALQQGRAEHAMLDMMARLSAALPADGATVRIALVETEEDAALQVQLLSPQGELARCELALDVGDDVEALIDDVRDALSTLGIDQQAIELTAT